MIDVFVYGEARPKGSAKAFVVGKRAVVTSTTKGLKPWEQQVASELAATGIVFGIAPVRVTLMFHGKRPKGHFRTNGLLTRSAPHHKTTKPDIDKLARAILDAITMSGVIKDDAQVVSLHAAKVFAQVEGCKIKVEAC
jgi:Holliday junction resolvase RusA-like endonuclease